MQYEEPDPRRWRERERQDMKKIKAWMGFTDDEPDNCTTDGGQLWVFSMRAQARVYYKDVRPVEIVLTNPKSHRKGRK